MNDKLRFTVTYKPKGLEMPITHGRVFRFRHTMRAFMQGLARHGIDCTVTVHCNGEWVGTEEYRGGSVAEVL